MAKTAIDITFAEAETATSELGRGALVLSGGFSTRQIDTPEGFYALEDDWHTLYETSGCTSVFSSWEWISEWYSHFLPTLSRWGQDASLFVLAVDDRQQRLVGLLPFIQVPAPYALLGQRRLIQVGMVSRDGLEPEEPTLLCRADHQAEVLRTLRRHLADRPRWGGWNHFTMQSLHPGGVISTEGISHSHSSQWHQSHFFTGCLTVSLPPRWNDFRSRLSKSMRDNLAYYPRRLSRTGLPWSIRYLETPADVEEAVPLLTFLHKRRASSARGVPHCDHLPTTAHVDFITHCLPLLAARGQAFIALLEVNGIPIAAQAFLQSVGVVTFYYSGFDSDWHEFSPVTILGEAVIRRAILQRQSKINFLPGEMPWKSRWQAHPDTPKQFWVGFSPHPVSLAYSVVRQWYRRGHL